MGEVRRPIFDAVVDQEFDECPKTRKLFSLLENTIRVLVLEVVRDVLINKLDADIKNRVKIYKEMEKHELGNKINL